METLPAASSSLGVSALQMPAHCAGQESVLRLNRCLSLSCPRCALQMLVHCAATMHPTGKGESRPTAAIPMENPYCSCRLTGSACLQRRDVNREGER